jgi:hypothetical protein
VDLPFLQCPVEVDELFRPGTRGAHPSKEVLLDSVGLGMTRITFPVHLPKGTLKSHQSTPPHAVLAPSLLSSSLSQARSCSRNSTAITDAATVLKGEEVLH